MIDGLLRVLKTTITKAGGSVSESAGSVESAGRDAARSIDRATRPARQHIEETVDSVEHTGRRVVHSVSDATRPARQHIEETVRKKLGPSGTKVVKHVVGVETFGMRVPYDVVTGTVSSVKRDMKAGDKLAALTDALGGGAIRKTQGDLNSTYTDAFADACSAAGMHKCAVVARSKTVDRVLTGAEDIAALLVPGGGEAEAGADLASLERSLEALESNASNPRLASSASRYLAKLRGVEGAAASGDAELLETAASQAEEAGDDLLAVSRREAGSGATGAAVESEVPAAIGESEVPTAVGESEVPTAVGESKLTKAAGGIGRGTEEGVGWTRYGTAWLAKLSAVDLASGILNDYLTRKRTLGELARKRERNARLRSGVVAVIVVVVLLVLAVLLLF